MSWFWFRGLLLSGELPPSCDASILRVATEKSSAYSLQAFDWLRLWFSYVVVCFRQKGFVAFLDVSSVMPLCRPIYFSSIKLFGVIWSGDFFFDLEWVYVIGCSSSSIRFIFEVFRVMRAVFSCSNYFSIILLEGTFNSCPAIIALFWIKWSLGWMAIRSLMSGLL